MWCKWHESDQRWGFYERGADGDVEITSDEHAALFAAQPQGWVIGRGGDGRPCLVDPAVPTAAAIIRERNRRLAGGFEYDFGDSRGVHRIGTTAADMVGWDEVSMAASALIATGQGQAPISIATDTGPCVVTALEWQQILLAATVFRQPIWLASFAIQEMGIIPADFTDDRFWEG